jgi:hypothetical protein
VSLRVFRVQDPIRRIQKHEKPEFAYLEVEREKHVESRAPRALNAPSMPLPASATRRALGGGASLHSSCRFLLL